ncbi:hypothetical protein DM02DRAFT_155992 [Periconia macrospinosa]|uniref:Uncharacterized protein n=1 Tax=Periconia macrospinosa TaxID=97972 RepID=A0A2V1ECD3_9PLEO|nr:hypothetical protein DM02DRAFT_155992 [Periconia macrospinosa]
MVLFSGVFPFLHWVGLCKYVHMVDKRRFVHTGFFPHAVSSARVWGISFFLTASSNTLRGLRGKHHIGTSLHAGKRNMDGEYEPALMREPKRWIEGTAGKQRGRKHDTFVRSCSVVCVRTYLSSMHVHLISFKFCVLVCVCVRVRELGPVSECLRLKLDLVSEFTNLHVYPLHIIYIDVCTWTEYVLVFPKYSRRRHLNPLLPMSSYTLPMYIHTYRVTMGLYDVI